LTNRQPVPTTRRTKPALALLWLVLAASAARAEEVGPQLPVAQTLQVKERSFDAGKVDQGAKLRHVFQLKNTGKVPLSIDAKPG
jgi:uncharacterized protein DUF1573